MLLLLEKDRLELPLLSRLPPPTGLGDQSPSIDAVSEPSGSNSDPRDLIEFPHASPVSRPLVEPSCTWALPLAELCGFSWKSDLMDRIEELPRLSFLARRSLESVSASFDRNQDDDDDDMNDLMEKDRVVVDCSSSSFRSALWAASFSR